MSKAKLATVLLLTTTLFTSCGLQRQMNELKNRQAQAEADSQNRDAQLQAQLDTLSASLVNISAQLASMDAAFAESSTNLANQDAEIQATVSAMQAQQSTILVQMAALQGQTSVVGTFNPCGVQAANEEFFLKLSDGRYLASFSQNGSALTTRFTILNDGNYTTTDQTSCSFTVSNGGTVISNEHN